MSKFLLMLLISITCLLLNTNTTADIFSDLNKCSEIQESKARLNCFDNLSMSYNSTVSKIEVVKQVTQVPQTQIPEQDKSPIQKSQSQLQSQTESQTKKQAKVEVQSAEMSFGLNAKAKEIKTIKSEMIGQFSAWKKGMKIYLQNGQVWKVTQKASGYKRITNPKITITSGFFGSYNATVEGLNSKAKVKRIK